MFHKAGAVGLPQPLQFEGRGGEAPQGTMSVKSCSRKNAYCDLLTVKVDIGAPMMTVTNRQQAIVVYEHFEEQ